MKLESYCTELISYGLMVYYGTTFNNIKGFNVPVQMQNSTDNRCKLVKKLYHFKYLIKVKCYSHVIILSSILDKATSCDYKRRDVIKAKK